MKRREKKMSTGKKAMIAGGVLVTGGALYFAWDKFFRKKETPTEEVTVSPAPSTTKLIASSTSNRNDRFPLKRNSLGNRVRLLQLAIQKIIGKTAYPDSEIDGDFGPKTESALVSAGLPISIDETTFNRITGSISSTELSTAFNPIIISSQLYSSAQAKDLNGVLAGLRQIRNTGDYTAVNRYFLSSQSSGQRSIVTYLLDIAFSGNQYAKQEVRREFLRIGLKSSSIDPINKEGVWSLSGWNNDLITITDTYVADKSNRRIPVKAKTILGEELSIKNGLSYFKGQDGQIYSVPTIRVKYA